MSKFEYRTDKDILYINLSGRIDASNASEVENSISEIRKANEGLHTVLDADTLEYISSAGLRIILRLRKEESLDELASCNDRDVYILWLGDKLSNMRSFYRIWKNEGDSMWQSFNQKDPEQQFWYYSTVAELTSPLKDFPAWQEYSELVKTVFGRNN